MSRMKRWRRYIFHALSALSLLLCVAAVALWVRSGSDLYVSVPSWMLATLFAAMPCLWIYNRNLRKRAMRWARGGLGIDELYARGVVRPFVAIARELEVGAARLNVSGAVAAESLGPRASRLMGRMHPESARSQQAFLLVGMVTLLGFWVWSAR